MTRAIGFHAVSRACIAGLALAACQVASHSSPTQPEVRLPERNHGSPPPVIAPPSYAVDARELLPSSLLPSMPGAREALEARAGNGAGGTAARSAPKTARFIAANLALPLPSTTFQAGHSYRLTFSAHLLGAAEAKVSIKFRTADKASFRTFQERVISTESRQYQLEFSAPEFVAAPELAIEVSGVGLGLESISLCMRAALSNTQPVSSWAGSFVPDGYGLVFNDEFNGSALDRKRWFTRYIYGGETLDRLNKEAQRYTDNGNHRLAGGVLYLTAKLTKTGPGAEKSYESGMIRSDFTTRYGFLEARVKMPSGLGVWPAFWLNPDASDTGMLGWPPEIDVFEFVNNGKEDKLDMIHVGLHSDAPGSKLQNQFVHPRFDARNGAYTAPFDFSGAFHTIAAEWTPEDVTFYVDGSKIVSTHFEWRYREGTLAAPAHILLNLAIGDGWAGRHGIDDSAFPQALAVDWVRVYRRLKTD